MFCTNCGKPVDDGSRFCSHCGSVQADDGRTPSDSALNISPGASRPVQPSSSSTNTVLKNCLIAAGIIVGAVILATALFICFNDDAREAFKEGFKEGYEETVGSEVQYLSLSPEKRDKLKADLFERLDRYFISALEDDESLMQLILLSAMGENSEVLEEAILNKMLPILEEWIEDNNIDADSFTESDSEEIGVDYVLHLLELIVSEVE